MPFGFSARGRELYDKVSAFIGAHIIPNEFAWEAALAANTAAGQRWTPIPMIEELKAKARAQGLWNLFSPDPEHGPGLSNLDYAPIAELTGRNPWAAEVFNCSAPDSGNMEILARFGTADQKARWLAPLLAGEIRSCFAMTEPESGCSDATNVQTRFVREGDEYVVSGRKWWSTGAGDPRCELAIVMGRALWPDGRPVLEDEEDDDGGASASPYLKQTMLLVPLRAPGVRIERMLTVFGYDDAPHGHAEISFREVRVPCASVLLGPGRGFEIAQARLGPGRIHHCMRTIGAAERALSALCHRAKCRRVFGQLLAQKGTVESAIAESRIELEQARLLVLKAAPYDRCRRPQAGAAGDRDDQGRRAAHGVARGRPRHPGARRRRREPRPRACARVRGAALAPTRGRPRRGALPHGRTHRAHEVKALRDAAKNCALCVAVRERRPGRTRTVASSDTIDRA
jgi:alkylation response protein AidB-like acyl-CoA dehydrogenase